MVNLLFLLLYVDDMLVAGTSPQIIRQLKKELAFWFAMKDLGAAKKIVGMNITRDRQKKVLTLSKIIY